MIIILLCKFNCDSRCTDLFRCIRHALQEENGPGFKKDEQNSRHHANGH